MQSIFGRIQSSSWQEIASLGPDYVLNFLNEFRVFTIGSPSYSNDDHIQNWKLGQWKTQCDCLTDKNLSEFQKYVNIKLVMYKQPTLLC